MEKRTNGYLDFVGTNTSNVGVDGFNYLRIRRAAKIVDNEEFEALIRTGQLIDLRDPAEFHRKHILGARNIPSSQLKTSLAALRKG